MLLIAVVVPVVLILPAWIAARNAVRRRRLVIRLLGDRDHVCDERSIAEYLIDLILTINDRMKFRRIERDLRCDDMYFRMIRHGAEPSDLLGMSARDLRRMLRRLDRPHRTVRESGGHK